MPQHVPAPDAGRTSEPYTCFHEGTHTIDYTNSSVTQNTRTAYPIYHIPNAVEPSRAGTPDNIFFLAADAFGVTEPITKTEQEPGHVPLYIRLHSQSSRYRNGRDGADHNLLRLFRRSFSAFAPNPVCRNVRTEDGAGECKRLAGKHRLDRRPLRGRVAHEVGYARAMITAALKGELDQVAYTQHPIFGVDTPDSCPNVPAEILNPRNTWQNKEDYALKATNLAAKFVENF